MSKNTDICKECGYVFNITDNIKTKQKGGKINNALNNFFKKIKAGEKLTESDISKISYNNLKNDERYERMTKKDQNNIRKKIKAIDKDFYNDNDDENNNENISHGAFYICKFCSNYKKIKPGEIIYSKNYEQTDDSDNYYFKNLVHDNTLPRTKNYICGNSKCKTHNDPSLKEAVLTKNSLGQIIYICCECKKHWINII